MNRKNMYKFGAFSGLFSRNFLILSAVFLISVMVGTAAAQFADLDVFRYSSVYGETSFPLTDVLLSSLRALRIIAFVFLFAFTPAAVYAVFTLLAFYGFSFSYASVFLSSSGMFLSDPVFYEHILSFVLIFPVLLFYASYAVSFSSVSKNEPGARRDFFIRSIFILFTVFLLSAAVRSVIYIIFSILQ